MRYIDTPSSFAISSIADQQEVVAGLGIVPFLTSAGSGDHAHSEYGAGPHDGTMADWGGGKYHVEFTVDYNKKEATVYLVGSDEKSPSPIKADRIDCHATRRRSWQHFIEICRSS